MDTIFYYRTKSEPYKVNSTTSIDDFIIMLYDGSANIISNVQATELKLLTDYIQNIKKIISSYQLRVPLYDISVNRIFLVHDTNVYPRIFYDNYRFIDKLFY